MPNTASSPVAAPGSVREFLEGWLAHMRGRVRRGTFEGYESLVRLHALPTLGELELIAVTPLRLQRLYGELLAGDGGRALAGGSVLNLHLVLTQAFGQAVRWQLLLANPAAGAQPLRPRRSPRLVADPQLVERVLAATEGSPFELPCALAVATGMRRGEILALRWSDLDADWSAARVMRTLQPTQHGLVFEEPKTQRSRRTVLLPVFVRPYLQRQHERQQERHHTLGDSWHDDGLLIDRGNGAPLNPDSLSAGWSRFLRKQSLPPLRFHDLRHAHATLLLLQGVHPKIVSERLGHASVGITLDTYSHVLPTMQEEAAQAFDSLFPAAR
ncbi:MAG TPA: site-specific integrase [Gaiellaceae bacterium]|nr:site-specific integrase [Gaiellaceae bacterium]